MNLAWTAGWVLLLQSTPEEVRKELQDQIAAAKARLERLDRIEAEVRREFKGREADIQKSGRSEEEKKKALEALRAERDARILRAYYAESPDPPSGRIRPEGAEALAEAAGELESVLREAEAFRAALPEDTDSKTTDLLMTAGWFITRFARAAADASKAAKEGTVSILPDERPVLLARTPVQAPLAVMFRMVRDMQRHNQAALERIRHLYGSGERMNAVIAASRLLRSNSVSLMRLRRVQMLIDSFVGAYDGFNRRLERVLPVLRRQAMTADEKIEALARAQAPLNRTLDLLDRAIELRETATRAVLENLIEGEGSK